MKRAAEIFVTVCFLAFLAGAMLLTVLREPATVSFYENRVLAKFPEYSAEAVGDGSYTTQLETYFSDHAAARGTMLTLKARIDLALRRPVVNNIVITKDYLLPYLSSVIDPSLVEGWADAMADNLQRISNTVAEYGGYYCYVAVPCQYAYFEDEYPWYLNNNSEFSRLSIQYLSQAMAERGVGFLDMRAVFQEAGMPPEYGSKVDNHYTMEGAFFTYRALMQKIAADTGLEFPILDWDDVEFQVLPNEYLGSRERKLINVETRDESLSLAWPKEGVPYTRTDNGQESSMYVYGTPYDDRTVDYTLYMGGDIANTVIDTGRDELPSILIYGDSFTNPLECVAYLSFDEMHSIDLRHYTAMSLEDYIRLTQPDIVVCIRDYEVVLYSGGNGAGPS